MPSDPAAGSRRLVLPGGADALTADPGRVDIREVDPAGDHARGCLLAYYDELAQRFPGGFEVERSRDPLAADLRRPRGAFLVALDGPLALGCVGLKGNGSECAEIKRLWVSPRARGRGLALRLMASAEQAAGELGVRLLRLDSHRSLHEAIALYRGSGWTEIARFNDDPYAQVFFEKRLAGA